MTKSINSLKGACMAMAAAVLIAGLPGVSSGQGVPGGPSVPVALVEDGFDPLIPSPKRYYHPADLFERFPLDKPYTEPKQLPKFNPNNPSLPFEPDEKLNRVCRMIVPDGNFCAWGLAQLCKLKGCQYAAIEGSCSNPLCNGVWLCKDGKPVTWGSCEYNAPPLLGTTPVDSGVPSGSAIGSDIEEIGALLDF